MYNRQPEKTHHLNEDTSNWNKLSSGSKITIISKNKYQKEVAAVHGDKIIFNRPSKVLPMESD